MAKIRPEFRVGDHVVLIPEETTQVTAQTATDRSMLVEADTVRGQYDLPCEIRIIDHARYGRLLLVEGFGGMDTVQGGTYRWEHGAAYRLLPTDTLAALRNGEWNESTTLYEAVIAGYEDSRPPLNLPVRRLAEST